MDLAYLFWILCARISLSFAQESITSNCHSSQHVVCVDKYLSVLPYHFYRQAPSGSTPVTIGEISLPSNYSSVSQDIASAEFLVFDQARGLPLLGDNPSYEMIFNVSSAVHEAPVYWKEGNLLFLSQLAPPPGYLPQLIVDLNANPPTLSEFLSDPPVYAPNGGTFYGGLVYWGK
jgi:hypothetical protein